MWFAFNENPLLPFPNSKKRNLREKNPGFLPHFCFLKMGEIQRGSISHWKRLSLRQNDSS